MRVKTLFRVECVARLCERRAMANVSVQAPTYVKLDLQSMEDSPIVSLDLHDQLKSLKSENKFLPLYGVARKVSVS